jgi:hypothetical protein
MVTVTPVVPRTSWVGGATTLPGAGRKTPGERLPKLTRGLQWPPALGRAVSRGGRGPRGTRLSPCATSPDVSHDRILDAFNGHHRQGRAPAKGHGGSPPAGTLDAGGARASSGLSLAPRGQEPAAQAGATARCAVCPGHKKDGEAKGDGTVKRWSMACQETVHIGACSRGGQPRGDAPA